MIDAYEVGIELALQDGVSAGLEVVARELAALDVAVAASSAGLVALTRTAEAAAAAVAAAAGVSRPARVVTAGDRGGSDLAVGGDAAREQRAVSSETSNAVSPTRPLVTDGSKPVAGRQPEPSTPSRERVAAVTTSTAASPAGLVTDTPRPQSEMPAAVAPAMEQARTPVVQVSKPAQAPNLERPEGVRTATVAVALPAGARGERGLEGAPSAPVMPREPALPMHADVARAGSIEVSSVGAAPSIERRTSVLPSAGRGAAPLAAPTPTRSQPGVAMGGLFPERASAPQRDPDRQSAAGGGPVMLDGRLVGHWLSERMARDAARPAAGTTFFDVRQAPAWTPSGVL